jgi:tRNA modification GTPase
MTPPADTIAAIATPPGRGGIGVVRVSGSAVPAVIAGVIGRELEPRRATVVVFRGEQGEGLDEGVAIHFPAPHSYTGESVLELQGHGGPAVLRLVLQRCLALGARLAEAGEFTKRAFLNGKLDLAQAEGVADLIEAATATAARAAARSLSGAFSREIRALTGALIELRMFTEATLDFPDEDIDFLSAGNAQGKLATIRAQLSRVFARARQGALLRDGVAVVLVGAPNVGKSSLLNQLSGDEVAIVTPIPGTTRDTIERDLEISGVPLRVIDTAGLRPTDDPIEMLGIERTWAAVNHADLVVALADARTAACPAAADVAILDALPATLPRIVVHNKIDLAGVPPAVEMRDESGVWQRHVFLSAKTGAGVDLLRHEILAQAGAHEDMEDAFLARARHLAALRDAETKLAAAAHHLNTAPVAAELFAEELRGAQMALGAVTGEFTSDDLLGAIFSRFCIGK